MGNCQRRSRSGQAQPFVAVAAHLGAAFEDNEPWVLIQQEPNVAAPNEAARRRLIKAVRKIIMLLVVRRIWGNLGNWLSTRQSWRSPRNRRILSNFWNTLAASHIRRFARVFNHVERRQGKLQYKR